MIIANAVDSNGVTVSTREIIINPQPASAVRPGGRRVLTDAHFSSGFSSFFNRVSGNRSLIAQNPTFAVISLDGRVTGALQACGSPPLQSTAPVPQTAPPAADQLRQSIPWLN